MFEKRNIIGVFGTQGSGKTSWIRKELDKYKRVLILENGREEFEGSLFFSKKDIASFLSNKIGFQALYFNVEA